MSRDNDDQMENLGQALDFDNQVPPSLLAYEIAHQESRSTPNLLTPAKFSAMVQLMAQEVAERIHASCVNESMTRETEEALSDAF